ncbi:hypothetical protein AN1V17_32040 [Vallitalea sediminicola]
MSLIYYLALSIFIMLIITVILSSTLSKGINTPTHNILIIFTQIIILLGIIILKTESEDLTYICGSLIVLFIFLGSVITKYGNVKKQ